MNLPIKSSFQVKPPSGLTGGITKNIENLKSLKRNQLKQADRSAIYKDRKDPVDYTPIGLSEDFKRAKLIAQTKSRLKPSEKPTPTQLHVKKMQNKGYNYKFDDMLAKKHDKEMASAKELDKTTPVIKGDPEPKSYLAKFKDFLKNSKDPKTKYLRTKTKNAEKLKHEKPLDMKTPTEPYRSEYLTKLKVDDLVRKHYKNGMSKVQKPIERSKMSLSDIVNDNGFQGLTKTKGGQKIIDGVMKNLGSHHIKSKEIKKAPEYYAHQNVDKDTFKGADNIMLQRMKLNKQFNKAMDGKTKVVMAPKNNSVIDPNKGAKDAKSKNTKSLKSNLFNRLTVRSELNTSFDKNATLTESGIPERYRKAGFTKVGQKRKSTRPGKKWMVLAKKDDKFKVIHGGYKGMQDYTQHRNKERRKKFWSRMGGSDSGKTKDPFSPLHWHKKFKTW